MDKKGYIDLAELLTRKHTISDVSSQIFVNRMFHVISNGLLNDGIVKVRGLGTFKLIEVEDRVSVDVNTGQRVVIPGHYKVSFTCDSTMKEIVNKPFSQFETVVLNDGVDFSSIDTPAESDEPNLDDDDVNEEEDEIVVEKQKEQYFVETSEVEEETSAEEQTPAVEEDTIAEEQTPAVEEDTIAEEQTPGVEEETITEEQTPGVEEETIAEEQTPEVEKETITEEQTPGVEEDNPVENILLPKEEILPEEKVEDVLYNEEVDDVSDDKREASIGQEDADEEFNDFDNATDSSSVNDVVNDDDNIIVNSTISDDEIRNEVNDEDKDEVKDEVQDEVDDNNNDDDDNSDAAPSSGSKKHIFGYIILSLILLLIAAGAYYGGYLYGYQKGRADVSFEMHKQIMKCTHHPQTPSLEKDTTNVDTITKNTPIMVNDQSSVKNERNTDTKIENKTIVKTETKPESKTVSKAPATDDLHAQYAAKDVRVRLGAYRIVGTDHEELVRPGDNVRKLSRRCLGEGMECYVEVYNGINSNTPLKAGQKLKIPKLVVKKKKKK